MIGDGKPDYSALMRALTGIDPSADKKSTVMRGIGGLIAPTSRPNALASIFGQLPTGGIGGLLASARRRADWNDRFGHWQRPFSVSEENSIGRAQRAVDRAVAGNIWLQAQGVSVDCQGSYYNNTNVRREADIDIRITHPLAKVDYEAGVYPEYADQAYAYVQTGISFNNLFREMRRQLTSSLVSAFGKQNVTVGNKAITLEGFTTSGAKVDVVPAAQLHRVGWDQSTSRFTRIEGIALLSTGGNWTENFPDQHHENGKSKRTRTRHRFKRMVRIFKRLQADMIAKGIVQTRVPSFLIECLVYAVEDEHFLVENDDLYGRVQRIALRMREQVHGLFSSVFMREINGIKPLFGVGQAWGQTDAQTFANAVVIHLGDA